MSTDRRARFRDYMKRVDPAASPEDAMGSGFYLPPPNSLAKRIGDSLELDPGRSHLITGVIGSGKTTTLLAIQRKINQTQDIRSFFVDFPVLHRLDQPRPAALIAATARTIIESLGDSFAESLPIEDRYVPELLKNRTAGYFDYGDGYVEQHDPPSAPSWVPGHLETPKELEEITELRTLFSKILVHLPFQPVMLIDGLDRIANTPDFETIVKEDLPALAALKVGIIVVGPPQVWFGPQKNIRQMFSQCHLHGAIQSAEFLISVLRKRVDAQILPDHSCQKIADYSGGILRDLISIARTAGEIAYGEGADIIDDDHVQEAGRRFGESLLMGIDKKHASRLKEFVIKNIHGMHTKERSFPLVAEVDIGLLMGRLLLEVPATPPRYRPHPTIIPLIPELPS